MDGLNALNGMNEVEAIPDWQAAAYTAIGKLPEWTCWDTGRKNTAKSIVTCMEVDCITVPSVMRNERTEAITMVFMFGERSAEFTITAPGVYHVILWSPHERSRKTHHKGRFGEVSRRAIHWLWPSSHSTFEDGMYQVMREGL